MHSDGSGQNNELATIIRDSNTYMSGQTDILKLSANSYLWEHRITAVKLFTNNKKERSQFRSLWDTQIITYSLDIFL